MLGFIVNHMCSVKRSNRPKEWITQQTLSDAEVVDGLQDAVQRREHGNSAQATFEERQRSLVLQNLPVHLKRFVNYGIKFL